MVVTGSTTEIKEARRLLDLEFALYEVEDHAGALTALHPVKAQLQA